eukprot:11463796-Alexandrium_andersonii.AAC.1
MYSVLRSHETLHASTPARVCAWTYARKHKTTRTHPAQRCMGEDNSGLGVARRETPRQPGDQQRQLGRLETETLSGAKSGR